MVALDVPTREAALRAVESLKGAVRWFKVGKQLFTSLGPGIVKDIKNASGAKIFLDLKFHDIPATVALAGKAAAELGVEMFNVHALGGSRMMGATVREVKAHCEQKGLPVPMMIAVTILTSMSDSDLKEIGIEATAAKMVERLAALAKQSGMDGVVASPEEARMIKTSLGAGFKVITPGVRPAWAGADDQTRIKTPFEAIKDGSDYLVVGRPILKAQEPAEGALRVIEEISEAMD